MDCSLPGTSVYGIFQARILEWVAISYSKGSSQPRDQTRVSCVSCIGRQIFFFYHCSTFEILAKEKKKIERKTEDTIIMMKKNNISQGKENIEKLEENKDKDKNQFSAKGSFNTNLEEKVCSKISKVI